jgi:hypothetical protein
VPVATLLERLEQADELETAERVARDWGITVPEMLKRWPPLHPFAGFIIDLYERFREKGYSYPRIGFFTGRDHSTVLQAIRYRRDADYRAKRRDAAKRTASTTPPSAVEADEPVSAIVMPYPPSAALAMYAGRPEREAPARISVPLGRQFAALLNRAADAEEARGTPARKVASDGRPTLVHRALAAEPMTQAEADRRRLQAIQDAERLRREWEADP